MTDENQATTPATEEKEESFYLICESMSPETFAQRYANQPSVTVLVAQCAGKKAAVDAINQLPMDTRKLVYRNARREVVHTKVTF